MWSAQHAIKKLNDLSQTADSENTSYDNSNSDIQYRNSVQDLERFKSKDGIQSAIFGPIFWMAIHTTSFNYPNNPTLEDKMNYKNWIQSIGKVLPCKYCRQNFDTNMKEAGFNESCLNSRDSFSKFCYTLHDEVNKMLHKKSPSYKEVREQYESFRAKCLSDAEKEKLDKSKTELGCIRPLHQGQRGKCVINVVPYGSKIDGFQIDEKCKPKV
tara:strand:- start:850 stop:1488 length:639 start_codon:yes stop_codon:yes gene_type:complete